MPLDFTKGSISSDYAEKVTPGTLAEDVEGDATNTNLVNTSGTHYHRLDSIDSEAELTLATKTLAFDANSLAFAAAFAHAGASIATPQRILLRLYMGGVLMQASASLPQMDDTTNVVLRDFKALSGNQTCILKAYNPAAGAENIFFVAGEDSCPCAAAIAVGSVKLA